MAKDRFLVPWCNEQIAGVDDINNTGEQLLCCAHLAEGRCHICAYTPDDIQPDGCIYNGNGFKDVDFEPVQSGLDAWKAFKEKAGGSKR